MRIIKLSMVFFAVVMVALFTVLPSQAAQKTAFTATGDPETVLSPGTRTCPGSPDQSDLLPCPDRMNVRGYVMTRPITASDSRVSGVATCEMNFNVDANQEGHYWGKCLLVLDEGGVAEGSYTGQMAWTGTPGMSPFFAIDEDVAHVTGGPLDGCLLKFEGVTDLFTGLATFTGYILDPHEKK